jgi:hypothetical protein
MLVMQHNKKIAAMRSSMGTHMTIETFQPGLLLASRLHRHPCLTSGGTEYPVYCPPRAKSSKNLSGRSIPYSAAEVIQ